MIAKPLLKKSLLCLLLVLSSFILGCEQKPSPTYDIAEIVTSQEEGVTEGVSVFQQAFQEQRSGFFVSGQGQVIRLLSDDLKGSRHQRFLVRLENDQTLLMTHNIDLAPRVKNLAVGDEVLFTGMYEWNEKGGVVHWTHRDPSGRKPGGWIKHKGQMYQ